MKYIGTVDSFDTGEGHGLIKPETGGAMLRFERGAFSWATNCDPTVGLRISYDVGRDTRRQRCALNLRTI